MKKSNTYNLYYDEEGDFLEVTFGIISKKNYVDEIEPGIFVKKDEDSDDIVGIGILSFKKRAQALREILQKINLNFPLEVGLKV